MILFNWIHKQCCLSLCSFYLDLPESLGAGGGCGGLPQRGPEEDVLLLLVLVTGQKLLLLGVKQPHHVSLTRGQGKKNSDFCNRYLHAVGATDLKIKYKITHPLQHVFPVVAELHEQGNLPAGVAVDGVDLRREAENKEKREMKRRVPDNTSH